MKKIGNTTEISIHGRVNFETNEPFKEDLVRFLKDIKQDSVPKNVIFDLKGLEFVGSSGITTFVQTLKSFNGALGSRPAYVNVRSEFQKIIRAFDNDDSFEFMDDTASARKRHDN